MSSNPKHTRVPLLPGVNFAQCEIPVTRQPQRIWFRVHRTDAPPVLFGNFPHHRFSHSQSPHRLLYIGATIQTCLWEYFGDDVFQGKRVIPAGKWQGCSISQIIVPEIKVCAVNLERIRDTMSVDKASLLAANLTIPQSWSLAIQQHPTGFEAIKYSSRFLDQPCLALFDRHGLSAKLKTKTLGPLSSLDAAVDWLDERKAALV